MWPPERRQGLYSQRNTKGTHAFASHQPTPKAATSLASPPFAEPSNQLIQATGCLTSPDHEAQSPSSSHSILNTPREARHLPCLLGHGLPSSRASLLFSAACFVLSPGRHSLLSCKTGICQSDSLVWQLPTRPLNQGKGSDRAPSFSLNSKIPTRKNSLSEKQDPLAQQC